MAFSRCSHGVLMCSHGVLMCSHGVLHLGQKSVLGPRSFQNRMNSAFYVNLSLRVLEMRLDFDGKAAREHFFHGNLNPRYVGR